MNRDGCLTDDPVGGYSPDTLALADELRRGQMPLVAELPLGDMVLEVRQGRDSLWLLARWPGAGGVAFRTAFAPGAGPRVTGKGDEWGAVTFDLDSPLGHYTVRVESRPEQRMLHWTVTLTPAAETLLPAWPTDVYPLDAQGDPTRVRGTALAGQAGAASGFLYLTISQPRSGSLLYLQNLTALNDLCERTGTPPTSCVGGHWPQLGYRPPGSQTSPLPPGEPTVLSDAWACLSPEVPDDERAAARLFLDLLAGLYPSLAPPPTEYHDWPDRAERTLRDLDRCADATVMQMGHRFIRPYIGAEPPDAMAQLAVLEALLQYQDWAGREIPLAAALRAGVPDFFDPELGAFRRYLPTVGEEKEADNVDSWYLYHPLMNLARSAARGDEEAQKLFFASIDFAIKVARHFEYRWPVTFHIRTLEVLIGPRQEGEPGQSDVGGLYAYVMLQAWDLSGEERFLQEAQAAVRALSGYAFGVAYQMNLTAWGAVACLRLTQITGDPFFEAQGDLLLASYFQHACFFESRLGWAKHYPVFFGELCLSTGEYMAPYECFESSLALREYVGLAGDSLRPALRLLLTEAVRYTPTRAWHYYPDTMPAGAISPEVREGRIEPDLSLPLEDLFPFGQPAGPTGQEVYGCGMAFALTTHGYHRFPDAPFLVYSEYPLEEAAPPADRHLHLLLRGDARYQGRLRLIPTASAPLPPVGLSADGAAQGDGTATPEGHREYMLPGGSRLELAW